MATLNRRARRNITFPARKSNNRKETLGRKIQVIYSEPKYLLKERYITDHMLEKATIMGLNKKEALSKYGKNRYIVNPNAKPIKVIHHYA